MYIKEQESIPITHSIPSSTLSSIIVVASVHVPVDPLSNHLRIDTLHRHGLVTVLHLWKKRCTQDRDNLDDFTPDHFAFEVLFSPQCFDSVVTDSSMCSSNNLRDQRAS